MFLLLLLACPPAEPVPETGHDPEFAAELTADEPELSAENHDDP